MTLKNKENQLTVQHNTHHLTAPKMLISVQQQRAPHHEKYNCSFSSKLSTLSKEGMPSK